MILIQLIDNFFIGVSHVDDTIYLMNYTFNTDETKEDEEMSKFMLDIWMAYAQTG